jgi:hypothetical protein
MTVIGTLAFQFIHRGDVYQSDGGTFALLNGQTLSRSAYSKLSALWPSGLYGSTDSTIVLPNFNNSFVRGLDMNTGRDPEVFSRIAPSGITPSGASLGSFQSGSMKAHEHPSGVSPNAPRNGPNNQPYAYSANITTTGSELASTVQPFTVISGAAETGWQPPNYGMYPYILIA